MGTEEKRCVERLKNSRSRLLEKYRQIGDATKGSLLVQEVMEMEWNALQSANQRLPSLWKRDGVSDVRKLAIIEEYHKSQQFEEKYFNSVVEGMEEEGKLICPMCHANNLTVNSHFTSCPCGLYINTMGRSITADVLRRLLEMRVTEHLEECLQNPVFSVTSNADRAGNLMMSCKVCDYLAIVL
ncbi:RPA-interacting protein isoform X1 [Silurus meridionalis]|nr:RPA-interacting protein isoform X1 [Silurus meridionalis]